MKATQSTINNFFALPGTVFSIPVYQRNYTWEEENCEKLLQDIVSISQNKKTHFMGSITYILHFFDDEKSLRKLQEFVIIDGQQRITTLMLLLKAIETKIPNEGIKKEIDGLLNLSGQKLRLKPIKSDKEAFDLVMQNRSHEIQGVSHIRNNYRFFTKELENYLSKGYRIEEIYGTFLRLKIVAIGLELGEDDPQVVFESINATGVQLKGLDLIRNYLMMGENSDNQNRLYNTYWVPLEDWLGERDLNDFIKTYLRIYLENKLSEGEREVYYALKDHHREKFPNDIEGLMSDMREYGRIYQIFLDRDHYFLHRGDPQQLANLRLRIKDLVKIKFGVAKPFVLRCARDFEEGKLDYENFHEILQILTSYFVRRSVCGDSSPTLTRVLYSLYRQLENVSVDALKRYLGRGVGQTAFPNDDKIKAAFLVRNAYAANQVCKFILLEIEKLSNAEPPREENLEVEHFYPKTPTQEWRDRVGDYFTFEQDYLHNFGNLTLSGQNQRLGNKSYEAKIALMEKYSSLHLNGYFTNNTHSWGIEEVKARSEYLADQFCQVGLFKDLPKEYREREINKTLDDDLTSHNLQSVKLPNHQRKITRNAKELASTVIDYLLENAREAFESYTDDESQRYICWDKAKAQLRDRDGALVVPFEKYGFYFVSNASYQTTGSNLKDLILGCDLNPKDFIV
ncbi:rloF [Helicobacter pylori PZ5080]|uniref:RloF n=1 Tax=Helicobacter pylori PZ5080 TaxID=1337394 RepID=T2SPC8_HELPX|nr:rloF [Helicobacter pylori PZ5080]